MKRHYQGTSKQIRKYGTRGEKSRIKNDKINHISSIHELLSNKKTSLALKSIKEYINKYSLDCYIIHEYGKYYTQIDNYNEAKGMFFKNIENQSDNMYYSMYEIARIYKYECNYDKAIYYYEKIINSNHPNKCYPRFELAKIYFNLKNYEKALELLEILISDKAENYGYALELIIDIKLELNNIEEAEQYFLLLEEAWDNSNYKESENKFYKGEILVNKGKISEAKVIFEEIINNHLCNQKRAKYELAKIYSHHYNEFEKSNILLEKLLNNQRHVDIDTLVLIISNYISMNDKENALNYMEDLNELIDYYNCQSNYYDNLNLYFKARIEVIDKNYDNALIYLNQTDKMLTAQLWKIYLLISKEEYIEGYQVLQDIIDNQFNKNFRDLFYLLTVYFNETLNLKLQISYTNLTYLERMIIDYDKKIALEHISEHKIKNKKKLTHSLFYENIDINELYDYVSNEIRNQDFIKLEFADIYFVKYKNVGYIENDICNYIKVICIPNTKKIISMYPINNVYKFVEEEKTDNKVKVNSRIDKFNKKYGYS